MQTNDVVDLRLPMYVVGDVVGRGDRTFPIATALELGGVGMNRCNVDRWHESVTFQHGADLLGFALCPLDGGYRDTRTVCKMR